MSGVCLLLIAINTREESSIHLEHRPTDPEIGPHRMTSLACTVTSTLILTAPFVLFLLSQGACLHIIRDGQPALVTGIACPNMKAETVGLIVC